MFFAPEVIAIRVNTPPPHSAPNAATSPFYKSPYAVNPNAYPGAPGIIGPNSFGVNAFHSSALIIRAVATTSSLTSRLSRQRCRRETVRSSTVRSRAILCDKYLTVFGDFKYARSFFDASLAAVPFTPDPFKTPGTNAASLVLRAASVCQSTNPFNPFTVADATIPTSFLTELVSQSRPVFGSAASTTPAHDMKNSLTGISSSTSDCAVRLGYAGDYFKTWNWELGFRYSRNEGQDLSVGEVSQPGLREALLDTDPAHGV